MDLDPGDWARMEFANCQLGDRRRTERLIKVASQTLARPDGSTPDQSESWGDCKAVYRLMDCDDVSFMAITAPHYERTRRSGSAGDVRLIINDTTEINYGSKRQARGLGQVGNNTGRGFFLHTALMRDPQTREVIGIAGQDLFYRNAHRKKKGAKNSRRRDTDRESLVWGRLIDQVGPPPAGVKWLHVCDRGADDYEVFCHARQQQCGWVIRACRLNRLIATREGVELSLDDYLEAQPVRGRQTLEIPASLKGPARTAQLQLRFTAIGLPRPRVTTAWMREYAPLEPLPMWVVELIEVDPPADVEPVHWVLLTSETVETVEQAQEIINYYAQRWAVEEYHKCLKTGCRVESRFYETSARLERITGLLAIVAVQLLRLRTLAQEEPERPASEVLPKDWVSTLSRIRRIPAERPLTMHQFVRHLAGLGGHLGRKSDGPPGWITLWRGLEKLLLILRGAALRGQRCG